MHSALRRLYRK